MAAIAVAAAAALTLAGCSASGGNADSNNPGGTVTWWSPNWDTPAAKKLVAEFEKKYPKVKVDLVETTWDTMATKIKTALQTGTAPDVITELTSRVNSYASKGELADVSSWYTGSMPLSDFSKGAITAVTKDKKVYGVPFRWDAGSMIYNKALFQKAGIAAPPTTEAELHADAAKLKAIGVAAYGWPFGNDANTQVRWLNEYFSQGGKFHDQSDGTVRIDADASTAALKELAWGLNDGSVSKSSFESDNTALQQLFINGQVAMYFTGAYDIDPVKKAGIDLGTAVWPGPKGAGTVTADGFSFLVPKKAKNPASAKALVEFLASTGNEATLTQTFPARISSAKAARFSDPLLQPFISQQNDEGVPVPTYTTFDQMTATIYSAVQKVALGQATPAAGTQEIQQQAANVLTTK